MNKALSLITIVIIVISACSPGKNPGESVKFQQYYAQGEQLYLRHCSNCHQKSGKGLGLLYPPLDESDYMDQNFKTVICIIKYGQSGELIVNEKNYNQPMPGVPTLTDLEIAEIATYVFNTWTHERGTIELKQVTEILQTCDKH